MLLCAQFSYGLENSAIGQIPCSTEGISCCNYFVQSNKAKMLTNFIFDCILMFRCPCQTGGRDKHKGTTGSVLQQSMGNGLR